MNTLKKLLVGLAIGIYSLTGATSIDEDVKCLAKNIYYEARGEPTKGKVAVALVTLNRTKHKNFPNTVCGVVYEKSQFSWTNTKTRKIVDYTAWSQSLAIAKQILYTEVEEYILPNFDALYFHNTKVSPSWKRNKKPIKIGNHYFYQ